MKALVIVLVFVLVACSPAVPYDQMPGSDLYGSANSNRMTADAAIRLAQMQEQALTATAQAPIVRITETAAAVAVQATQAQATSQAGLQTQQAALSATAIWFTPTPNATQTAAFAALNAEGTLIANNLERDRLALERDQTNNAFKATMGQMVPLLALVVMVGGILLLYTIISRRMRYQAAQVDARGNPLPILDLVDATFTDIDASPNYQGPVSTATLVQILAWLVKKKLGMPMLPDVTPERQDPVKHRDQLLDLATRGLPAPAKNEESRKAKAGEMMARLGSSAVPQVQVVAPELVRPILEDVKPQIARDAIDAELYETKEEGTV